MQIEFVWFFQQTIDFCYYLQVLQIINFALLLQVVSINIKS